MARLKQLTLPAAQINLHDACVDPRHSLIRAGDRDRMLRHRGPRVRSVFEKHGAPLSGGQFDLKIHQQPLDVPQIPCAGST